MGFNSGFKGLITSNLFGGIVRGTNDVDIAFSLGGTYSFPLLFQGEQNGSFYTKHIDKAKLLFPPGSHMAALNNCKVYSVVINT